MNVATEISVDSEKHSLPFSTIFYFKNYGGVGSHNQAKDQCNVRFCLQLTLGLQTVRAFVCEYVVVCVLLSEFSHFFCS